MPVFTCKGDFRFCPCPDESGGQLQHAAAKKKNRSRQTIPSNPRAPRPGDPARSPSRIDADPVPARPRPRAAGPRAAGRRRRRPHALVTRRRRRRRHARASSGWALPPPRVAATRGSRGGPPAASGRRRCGPHGPDVSPQSSPTGRLAWSCHRPALLSAFSLTDPPPPFKRGVKLPFRI